MRISERGLAIIRKYEGCRLTAYVCPAGVLTIGYGHTGPDVTKGRTITQQEADRILEDDVLKFEVAVTKAVKVPLTQGQFDALVSFTFNLGAGNLRASTLLRVLNTGDKDGAAGEFARWDKAGGKVLPGLTARRAAEADLFRTGV